MKRTQNDMVTVGEAQQVHVVVKTQKSDLEDHPPKVEE
jgi:hypothetical protein